MPKRKPQIMALTMPINPFQSQLLGVDLLWPHATVKPVGVWRCDFTSHLLGAKQPGHRYHFGGMGLFFFPLEICP